MALTENDATDIAREFEAANHTSGAKKVNIERQVSIEDYRLASEVKNMFYRARDARKPLVRQWLKNYQILRNRTWVPGRADWMPSPEVPEIYPIIVSMVGWMTDQRPQFEVAPAMQPHSSAYEFMSQLAWDLQTTLDATWQVQKSESEVEKMLWDGFVCGTGFLKTTWDNTIDAGLGNFLTRRIDPYTIYPDPAATSFDDMNYIIEARTMSLQELDRRWPGAAEKAILSGMLETVDSAPNRLDSTSQGGPARANPGAIAPAISPRYGQPGGSRLSAQNVEEEGVTVFECWIRSHEYNDDDPEDVKVYDEWSVVVVVGNYVLMNERARDLWSSPRHPYTRYVPHETGEFWGQSLVEMLAPSQLSINRLLSSIQLNVELTGNPIFLEDTRSGLSRTKMQNKPGQRLPVNANSRAEWMNPPVISPLVLDMIKFYIGEMERVSGLSAMTRGGTPQGRNSTDVLDSVQEASFVRVRMALRNLEYALREQGNIAASLIAEFYDVPRMIASVGPSGEQTSLALKGKHFYIPTEDGSVPMKFQLLVNAGSQLPTSSGARRADAAALFAMGALDQQAVLEAYNWPGRAEIVKRITAAQAAGTFAPPGARQRAGRQT